MGTIANILTGPVDFYRIDYAEALDPVSSNAVSWSGWDALGFQNEDGLEFEYSAEWFDIKVHSHNAPVKRELIGEALTVRFSLMECDLAQLVHAIAGGKYTAGETPGTNENVLKIGDKATIPYSAIGFEGVASTGEELVGFVPKVNQVGTVGLSHKKGGVREVPFEFSALADTSRDAGETLALLWEITSS